GNYTLAHRRRAFWKQAGLDHHHEEGHGYGEPGGTAGVSTLTIDVGGTKFSIAIFESGAMVRRELRATDREGGRDWMLQQIEAIVTEWKRDFQFDGCGIGFGGPVDFQKQCVVHSTHVEGWSGFDLPGFIESLTSVRPIM